MEGSGRKKGSEQGGGNHSKNEIPHQLAEPNQSRPSHWQRFLAATGKKMVYLGQAMKAHGRVDSTPPAIMTQMETE